MTGSSDRAVQLLTAWEVVRLLLDGYRPSPGLDRWMHPAFAGGDVPMSPEHAQAIADARRAG